jgi:hypothetical protein
MFFSIITFRLYGLIMFVFIITTIIKSIYIYWVVIIIFMILLYFVDFLPFKERLFQKDIFFWRMNFAQMQHLRLSFTIQGKILKEIIDLIIIGEVLNGKNDEYMGMLDDFLNFNEGSREILLNEIRYKPSIFNLKLIMEYRDSRNLDSILWIIYYKDNENDVNIFNKEMRHLKLFFKIVWDYEYYYFNKVEATIEIGRTELQSINLKSLFFFEPEGSLEIHFLVKEFIAIDLMKKQKIKELKINNLLSNLIRNPFLNFRGLQKRLYERWKEEFAYGKTIGLFYDFPSEDEDMREINKKKENYNKQVERNVEWVKGRIEEWRKEWEVERKEGKREFFKD